LTSIYTVVICKLDFRQYNSVYTFNIITPKLSKLSILNFVYFVLDKFDINLYSSYMQV